GGASAAEPRPAGAPPPRRSSHPDRQSSGAAAVDNRAALDRARRTGARRTIVTLVAAFIIALIAGVAIIRHGNFTIGGSRFIEDYVGTPADQAESALTHDGYSYTVTLAPSATATSGTVTSQDPIAHLPIGAHGTVHLVVSSGPELVGLVDLRSYSVDDALRFVKNVGLAAKVTEKYDKAAKGMVISQNPAPGTRLAAKSVVKIVVSKGAAPVAVPSLVSLTLDDAKKQLAQRHLNIVVGDRQATDTIAENVVISQDPKPGATAPAGSPVTVVVSTGPAQTGVPDVGSQSGADATNALNALGFRVRYNYVVQAGGIVGSVIAQFPAPGTPLAKGASVTLSIVVPGTVPDVGGLSLDRARGALQNSGYHAGRTIVVRQADGAPGSVARTDPAANVRLEPGASVDLYVIAAPNAAPAASGP
ncbi:MAG: PASTA domain-containing protein, partial [Vulcanimicrobiaceae bacterium]